MKKAKLVKPDVDRVRLKPKVERRKFKNATEAIKPKSPELAKEFRELCSSHTIECVTRLIFWVRSKDPLASINAARILMEHAHGKPKQQTALETPDGRSFGVLLIPGVGSTEEWQQQANKYAKAQSGPQTLQ